MRSQTPEALDILAAKLSGLDFSAEERAAFDVILARATAFGTKADLAVVDNTVVPTPVQNAVVKRTAKAAGLPLSTAQSAFRDALTFLRATAHEPTARLTPARPVDEAWHQFILFTNEYAAYCHSVAGCFIHHCPHIEGAGVPDRWMSAPDTYTLITSLGYKLTQSLWEPSTESTALNRLGSASYQT